MTLTEEDATRIKEQLLTQLTNFPEDKREQIKEQINSMTTEQVESFVEQNKLTHLNGQCIFCSITKNETKSYKISENETNIAILEINPLSKGHSLIIPLEHENGISESTKELAEEVSEKLKDKFNPKTIDSKEINIMGHQLIELTPIYGGETERKQATEEELGALQKEIVEEEIPETKEEKKEAEEIPKLKPRIP
jgi:histidine triad (HIT) family protein